MTRVPVAGIGRQAVAAALALAVVAAACGAPVPTALGPPSATPGSGPSARPSGPPPAPGHEVYGYVPYWEMDAGIADHVAGTDLTTLALFSVTAAASGAIDERQTGYRRITGGVGKRLVREAHARGVRVELVFSSFGLARNRGLFDSPEAVDRAVAGLVALAGELGVDGVNVDVETLDPLLVPVYASFVGALRDAVVAADPGDEVSVATSSNPLGAAMAAAAVASGADRVFLMGYDYRTSSSDPGATAPLDRADGDPPSLRSSLDLYAGLGVPVERTILGLPLYGMAWPIAGGAVGAPRVGPGKAWIPRRNTALLRNPAAVPVRDDVEAVDVYLVASDGSVGPPSVGPVPPSGAVPPPVAPDRQWTAVYVDSPATLARKLALANERGLAGAGFWAIGYERGLDGYTDLIRRFAAGEPIG